MENIKAVYDTTLDMVLCYERFKGTRFRTTRTLYYEKIKIIALVMGRFTGCEESLWLSALDREWAENPRGFQYDPEQVAERIVTRLAG